jgi:hypothetical protein
MEHPTGPDGPDWPGGPDAPAGTEGAEQAAAVGRGEPESAEPEGERARESQRVATTGEPRVDAALKLLDGLPGLPVSEHSEVFEQVHARLSDVLGELDSGPAGPAGG